MGRRVMAAAAAFVVAAAAGVSLVVAGGPADADAGSVEASALIDSGVAHLKRTTISYPQWVRRDYPPGVRETTEWALAFADFAAARAALESPPPPPPTEPPPPTTTDHPPPPPPPTTAPTTTAPPPSSGYPDASNTGVIDEAALRYWPGHEPGGNAQPVYFTTPGQVVENVIFSRAVIVRANNVTFRNVRWKFASDYWMLLVESEFSGVLVEDSEFDGLGGYDINAAVGGPGWTLRRVEIQGVQDGAKLSRDTHVYDSWIHNLWTTRPDPHIDGLQNIGGDNNVIRHNTIDVCVGAGCNAAVFLREYYGAVSNVLVENNRLLGGGWTFACCSDEGFGPATGIRLVGNRFGPNAYGPVTAGGNDGLLFRSGNVWDATGEPIPGG